MRPPISCAGNTIPRRSRCWLCPLAAVLAHHPPRCRRPCCKVARWGFRGARDSGVRRRHAIRPCRPSPLPATAAHLLLSRMPCRDASGAQRGVHASPLHISVSNNECRPWELRAGRGQAVGAPPAHLDAARASRLLAAERIPGVYQDPRATGGPFKPANATGPVSAGALSAGLSSGARAGKRPGMGWPECLQLTETIYGAAAGAGASHALLMPLSCLKPLETTEARTTGRPAMRTTVRGLRPAVLQQLSIAALEALSSRFQGKCTRHVCMPVKAAALRLGAAGFPSPAGRKPRLSNGKLHGIQRQF